MQQHKRFSNSQIINLLDDNEKELLQLLIKGMNTSEISKYLSMSYHDAAKINQSIKQKLNVSSVEDLKFLHIE